MPLAKAPIPTTPVPMPPALPSTPVLAKGTTVLQETGVLGPADLANYPARAGIPYKAFKVNLVAGKTYLLEMNKTDASSLDPCLILHNAQNQKLAATEKGGAEKASLLFKAPASEICVVFATTVGADKLGAFQLIVAEIAENQPAVAGNTPVPGNELLKGGKQYIPKNGRFTVNLPRGNSTGERTRTLRINNLPLSMEQAYSSVNGGNAYLAASITLPAAALRDLAEGQRLDTFRDVLLRSMVRLSIRRTFARRLRGQGLCRRRPRRARCACIYIPPAIECSWPSWKALAGRTCKSRLWTHSSRPFA